MSHDGIAIDLPDSTRRLIAYLALSDGPQERSLVAAILWPEKSDERAAANLRSSIWRMDAPTGVDLVSVHRSCIELGDDVSVDARDLQQSGWDLVHRGLDVSAAVDVDRRAFVAELLPGWYDDWVIAERERLTQLQLHFMEALAYALVRAGRIPEALDVAIRLSAADSLREGSQRVLLWAYCWEGSLGQARRQLERYRDELREEFGVEPSLDLASIMQAVAAERGRGCPEHAAQGIPVAAGSSR
ncbi:MAG: BTAD domain-containing putative transcriptional regulator [Ilumatobacter sp.]|uniref:AfsR/SARP family transcriptional regulator n=1 Tax=Ilumatobacter sp. TaxID=1967498 RepID=UPI00262EE09A|nr:BTAD domain-containing putative transcriptional regulator [Ilumatobacter sp.]MDJ0768571.1 BTAD domain-containing putative transcriptional regulator [Ilumatobacter sp.]